MIDQTSPIKTQPETVLKELPHALMRRPKFLPIVTHAHAPTRATAQSHALSCTLMQPTRPTRHSLPRRHISPSDVSTRHPYDVRPTDINIR